MEFDASISVKTCYWHFVTAFLYRIIYCSVQMIMNFLIWYTIIILLLEINNSRSHAHASASYDFDDFGKLIHVHICGGYSFGSTFASACVRAYGGKYRKKHIKTTRFVLIFFPFQKYYFLRHRSNHTLGFIRLLCKCHYLQ